MQHRLLSGHGRRPLLLALVAGVVLVLVGITGSALVAVVSSHFSSATLTGVAARDAALVELWVNDALLGSDLDADGPGAARSRELGAQLAALSRRDGILRIEIRAVDGEVLVASDQAVVGQQAVLSAAMRSAIDDRRASALIVEESATSEAVGGLPEAASVVQELFPIIDEGEGVLGVVAMWRDAEALLASLDDTSRDVMLVTLAAGILLSGILFFVFRAAQARLSRQHGQLLEATRRDPLTGLLNHGTIVGLLGETVESLAADGRFALALLDIDNFRLLNDTHGHEAGDDVLLRVAAIVAAEAGPDGRHVARFGPDELLLVLDGAGVTDALAAAGRIRKALESVSVQFGESEQLPVTVSAGIAVFPTDAGAVTELLSAATIALGQAKASGGDTVATYEPHEDDRAVSGSFDVLQGLVIAVDTKDRYTKRHSEDVARYAVFLARRLGLDEETLRTIHLAGLLHDVGKIGIPDVLLRKPSKLTAEEYGIFQQHVVLGDAIVRDVPNVEQVRAGIRYHHERWDGKGYVEGLEGDGIPLVGRVLAVADAFSAMTTTRPYRKALAVEEALKRLGDAAGTQLQEDLVAAFIQGIETAADAPLPGEEPVAIWRPELWVA